MHQVVAMGSNPTREADILVSMSVGYTPYGTHLMTDAQIMLHDSWSVHLTFDT